MIFCLNSMLAWLMKSPFAIDLIEKWSYDYIKMDCEGDKCYGVLAVHRICFALSLFHAILSAGLIGVRDTRDKRAAIQNGWVSYCSESVTTDTVDIGSGARKFCCGWF
jgi:hypothetical protein